MSIAMRQKELFDKLRQSGRRDIETRRNPDDHKPSGEKWVFRFY